MPLDLVDFDKKTRAAVRHFWQSRAGAKASQGKDGVKDAGERASVTAGKNMDGFLALIADVVKANGLADADIYIAKRVVTLPGYFRPTKLWDLLVMLNGCLIAAIELKSQVGPSFGNNSNNRAEEALGTAVDFWTAYREHAFGEVARPFLGWLILLEDCQASRKLVSEKLPHFPVFPEFKGASYAGRYDILCRKLMEERLYTSAALILSSRNNEHPGNHSSHSELTAIGNFVAALAGHIATEAARKRV
mgnify:CR=1 FL=1